MGECGFAISKGGRLPHILAMQAAYCVAYSEAKTPLPFLTAGLNVHAFEVFETSVRSVGRLGVIAPPPPPLA